MKLDLTTIDFKKESFISTLQDTFILAEAPDVLEVSDKESQTLAEKQITDYKKIGKLFLEDVKPLKTKLDNVKKAVIEFEKANESKVNAFVISQEKPIKEYKKVVFEQQQELKRQAEEKARKLAEEARQAEQERLDKIRQAEKERLDALEKSKVSVSEKIDELEEVKSNIQKLEEIVIPEIELKTEKVILKKDEIKTKKVFTIVDEKAFIEWALENNNTHLLNITINKSEFNKVCKNLGNLPFIRVTEEIV